MSRRRSAVVVTCEHASAAIPPALGDLGLPAAVRRSHRAWDPGALAVARALAKALDAPLFVGEWSRLVADLNRRDDHPRVVAARVDGRAVPGNQLDAEARAARLSRYWRPYRRAVEGAIRRAARGAGGVVHLSVHSFTPRLGGVERRNDVGLLHDPWRPREVRLCDALKAPLRAAGLSVRRNFPYFGHTDGLTSWLRARLPAGRYLGVEVECNQRLSANAAGERRLARALGEAFAAVLLTER